MTEEAVPPRRRLDRVLEPDYLVDVTTLSTDEVRERRQDCSEIENEVSYVRRLAQARIEILEAEVDRRRNGGSVGDLIAALPQILADETTRADAPAARITPQFAPSPDIEWNRGLERLVSDNTLANLPTLSDAELDETIGQLRTFESETSETRRALHKVIDELDLEIAMRHKVDQA
jgi:anti-sigma-K factor RsiG